MPELSISQPLTAAGFGAGARAVSAAWARLDGEAAPAPATPVWLWTPDTAAFGPSLGGGYLELFRGRGGEAGILLLREDDDAGGGGDGGGEGDEVDGAGGGGVEAPAPDPASLPPPRRSTATSTPTVLLEAHAVWAPSFRAPALYLRGRRQAADDRAAAAEAVVGAADLEALAFARAPDGGSAAGLLAPAEHPHLGGPWAVLHPCHTAGWMAALVGGGGGGDAGAGGAAGAARPSPASYVAAWLSVISPMLAVRVPAGLGAAVGEREGEGG